jgi:hypothetical protein
MTSRNVEIRVVRLEARSRIGRLSRLSRDEIAARVGEIYGRLINRHGEHSAVVSALAAIDPAAAQRLNALHQAGELQP